MKKAIVTGANGFIGGHVVKELVKHGIRVLALVRKGHFENIKNCENVEILEFDLDDLSKLPNQIDDRDFDVFYHFAWNGSAGEARCNVPLQLDNANKTVECLKLAKVLGCNKFVGAGSIMEKETVNGACQQGVQLSKGYIYGGSKLVSHIMSKAVATELAIDFVWGMITNAYGEGEQSPRFINSTLRKIVNHEPLKFTLGIQNYDFIHIDDVANAFYLLGLRGKNNFEYVIGSSNAKPLRGFIEDIQRILAPSVNFEFGEIKYVGGNMELEEFNTTLINLHTGFIPKVSFYEGITRTMTWIKEEEEKYL